jgi:hypothetical protein
MIDLFDKIMHSKIGQWTIEGDGWQSREMGGKVGSALYGSSLGSNPGISQNCKMDDIRKGVANTIF